MGQTQKTTIKDIAKECAVSLSTVSLVLNNNPRISEKTRNRVLAAVKKHGYQPNIHARGLATQTSEAISVVVPHLNHVFADIYFGEIVSGIYDRACDENYKVLLDVANEKFIQSQEYLNILKSRRVDGMLFIASSVSDDYLRAFDGSPYKFLLVHHLVTRHLEGFAVAPTCPKGHRTQPPRVDTGTPRQAGHFLQQRQGLINRPVEHEPLGPFESRFLRHNTSVCLTRVRARSSRPHASHSSG